MISFDPFARTIPLTDQPVRSASMVRSSVASQSGYRFSDAAATVAWRSRTNPSGRGYGHSFVFRRTGTGRCGERYGSAWRSPGLGPFTTGRAIRSSTGSSSSPRRRRRVRGRLGGLAPSGVGPQDLDLGGLAPEVLQRGPEARVG